MGLNKKLLFKFIYILLLAGLINIHLLSGAALSRPQSAGADRESATIGEYFDGEEFTYTIGFWWFKKAAMGKIGIHKKDANTYEITLSAETMGFIGFITSYRKDIYRAYVEETDDGKRFRTKRFEKIVIIGERTRYGYTDVDYNKRTYSWKSWGGGKEEKKAEEIIPPGIYYDDPLTGFYNFRFGVYGQIEAGKEFDVPTFPVKGVGSISVKIATDKEKNSRVNPDPEEVAYLADIVIDKELFGSQTGNVEVRFTKELIPVFAVAKDLILFGDVRGRLTEMTSSIGFKKPGNAGSGVQGFK
ncbi:MAG: hypothetical protein A3A85_06615 [Deltaproteobacteria bacterium RIFCSPLOWO2_01_FULL_42_9]|nr:MAG: hypothetical protein A3A85_06615 [Deltaproteobacteria bacterium RIFCSPLOWO2_01_FULL_42_9]